ncbi:MAG TPA: sigma 54-interacting transcriptional regulator [Thermoanaerobaculia bacterium]
MVHLLSGATESSPWLVPTDGVGLLAASRSPSPLSDTRTFIVSERLVPLAELERVTETIERADRAQWLDDFVRRDAYRAFLEDGSIPEAPVLTRIRQVGEPRRSYLAALGLIGESITDSIGARFLKQLGCKLDLDDLVIEGLTVRRGHALEFASRSVQQCFARTIPSESRASLCQLAATILEEDGDPFRCAALFEEAGERSRGIALLESRLAEAPSDVLRPLRELPRELVMESAFLCRLFVDALLASGRYLEARLAADALARDDRQFALARIDRRLGNYAAAEEHLRAVETRLFEHEILLAEILRLEGKFDEAESRFQHAAPLCRSAVDRVRFGYERALLALDLEEPADPSWISDQTPAESYYSSRFRSYAAVDRGAYETAIREATRASEVAADLASRIDAELDLVYARFLAGEWEEARHVARRALALIEETEGDRAAGGVLFTLAFLCADSGQWTFASRAVDRLRRFYSMRGDVRRSRELDLIAAQSALTRCAFDQAHQIASTLLNEHIPPEMREAAAVIVDEVEWILGTSTTLRSSGRSACVELRHRHALMRRRRGEDVELTPGFSRRLAEWETALRSRRRTSKPEPENRGEKLRLLRSFLAHDRRSRGTLKNEIEILARECSVEIASGRAHDDEGAAELAMLRLAATAAFPYGERDFGDARWRFVTRNRLGHFNEIGSLPPLSPRELDAFPPEAREDWVACSDSAWLFVEGLARWLPSSRDALASLVRIRSEHFNLKRISEQDESIVADAAPKSVEGILGSSPAIVEVVGLVVRLARTDVPICILGESGTGKELIARAIHRNSSRRSKPFTAVNCAALPENLIESELFGHVRGAFTGADRDRAGLIETTDAGTLFLDEIGELPPTAQAKLLRFLQEGEFRRVGDATTRTADVRIVAATNRKLEKAVDDGAFREDLYYRIRGVEVNVPPLRERRSDIVVLARHFLAREREKQRLGPERFLPEVEAVFIAYRWPGNVRELQNAVRAAFAIAGDSRQVRLDHLPERLRGVVVTRSKSGSLYDELNQFRKRLIERSLAESQGNQSQAAKRLGISRQALAYQIRELGILVT